MEEFIKEHGNLIIGAVIGLVIVTVSVAFFNKDGLLSQMVVDFLNKGV